MKEIFRDFLRAGKNWSFSHYANEWGKIFRRIVEYSFFSLIIFLIYYITCLLNYALAPFKDMQAWVSPRGFFFWVSCRFLKINSGSAYYFFSLLCWWRWRREGEVKGQQLWKCGGMARCFSTPSLNTWDISIPKWGPSPQKLLTPAWIESAFYQICWPL